MAATYTLTPEDEAQVRVWEQLPDHERRQIVAAIRILLGQDPTQYEDDPTVIEAAHVGIALYGPGGLLR